jgi:hypothetical protein
VEVEEETDDKRPKEKHCTIQDNVGRTLASCDYDVVFFDHTQGEVADFVTVKRERDCIRLGAYHCKSSGGANPGDRLEDLHEVCSQVVKNLWCLLHNDRLLAHIKRRKRLPKPKFLVGDYDTLRALLSLVKSRRTVYDVAIVQPGITQAGIDEELGSLLTAAHDYIEEASCEDLIVWGSA